MLPRMRRLVLAAVVGLLPSTALAANQMRPRSPAIFEDTPCITTVDKAVDDPVLHYDYAVGYDDTMLTPEELADSRTMQFLAIAEQRWDFKLPMFINQGDYDRSLANGDITMMFTDDDIFANTTLWSPESWVRITPDDARVPITMAQAEMGFDWDVTDVNVGTWMVSAYTFEPELNLWSFRFGAVRIVDSSAPDQRPGPSVFLQDADTLTANVGETYTIPGCIHADAGSTYAVSYGVIEGIDEPSWIELFADAPVVNGDIRVDFDPPAELASASVKIRIDVQDAMGGSYTAYSPSRIDIACSEGCGEESSGGFETDTGDATSSDESTGTTTGDDDGEENDEGGGFGFGGGGCRTTDPSPIGAALFLLLLGLSPRVRRRC